MANARAVYLDIYSMDHSVQILVQMDNTQIWVLQFNVYLAIILVQHAWEGLLIAVLSAIALHSFNQMGSVS